MNRSILLALSLAVISLTSCDRDRHRPRDPEVGNRPQFPWDQEPGDPWQAQRWVELGSQRVSHMRPEVVSITPGRMQGRFQQVRITVNRGDLELQDVVIVRDNGQRYEPNIRHFFKAGSRSRVIDLPSAVRGIREVRFVCRAVNRHERPSVTVFAR